MELNLIVESKNFEYDKDMQSELKKNPCEFCFLGKETMCAERKFCRWETHKEIFIKKEVRVEEPQLENVKFPITYVSNLVCYHGGFKKATRWHDCANEDCKTCECNQEADS